MNCKKIEDLLTLYIDNKLDLKLKSEVETHLNKCQKCNKIAEDFKKILNLSDNFKIPSVPESLIEKINTKLENYKYENNYIPFLRWALAATILFVFIFTGYFSFLKKQIDKKNQDYLIAKKEKQIQIEITSKKINKKIDAINNTGKEQIEEKMIELAKLPEQITEDVVVFRGGESFKKKKIIQEWKGFSKTTEDKKFIIINKIEYFKNIWSRHLNEEIPEIDFNTDIIIAAFSDEKEIQINEIKESNNKYFLNVKETNLKKIRDDTISKTSFHIIKIKASF